MGALPEHESSGAWFTNAVPTGVIQSELSAETFETFARRWMAANQGLKPYMRSDTQRVELIYGDRKLICERTEGGDRQGTEKQPLTVYKLRSSDDAPDIVALMGYHGSVEVRCQPLTAGRKAIGLALVYHGRLDAVTPNLYDANASKAAYWSVKLKNWSITASK